MSSWLVTLTYSHRGLCYPEVSKRTREVAMSLPAMTVRMDGPPGKERCEIMVTVRNCRQSEAVDVATTQAARLIDLAQLRLLG